MVLTTNSLAQQDEDFNIWSAAELRYELDKNWSFGIEGQIRLKENVSVIDEYFGEISVQRKLSKGFRLRNGFRFIRENDNQGNIQGYENHIRFHLDLIYKHDLDRLTFKYRLRYQNKNELGITRRGGDYAAQRIRLKTTGEYDFRNWKLDPELSGEIFNSFEKKGSENGFDKFRINFGTTIRINKKNDINLLYRFEKEFNVLNPDSFHILSIKYNYTI